MDNLKRMKVASKHWGLHKKLKDKETLENVNSAIALLEDPCGNGYGIVKSRDRLQGLGTERRRILQLREESWHLKSRVIWLQAGRKIQFFFKIMLKEGKTLIQFGK